VRASVSALSGAQGIARALHFGLRNSELAHSGDARVEQAACGVLDGLGVDVDGHRASVQLLQRGWSYGRPRR
jgi:hypothetical protein